MVRHAEQGVAALGFGGEALGLLALAQGRVLHQPVAEDAERLRHPAQLVAALRAGMGAPSAPPAIAVIAPVMPCIGRTTCRISIRMQPSRPG